MNKASSQKPGRLVSWLLDRSTREAEVQHVQAIGTNLRLVTFAGEQLRGAEWTPGDMVQLILSGSTLLGPNCALTRRSLSYLTRARCKS